MPTYKRPGVYLTEALTPTPAALALPTPGVAAFAGEWWKGPSVATLCQSWGDFATQFGGFQSSAAPVLANPWLGYSVYNYFNNGGQQCWVSRTLGDGGATASHTFVDQAATSPAQTLTVVSLDQGSWGNALYIEIDARGTGTGRFDMLVYYGGTLTANIVERWLDMSMIPTDPRYAPNMINATVGGSAWVTVSDQHSPTAAPNNAPAAIGPTALAGGIDPAAPTVTERQNSATAGSSPFDLVSGILGVNLPGEATTSVLNSLTNYVTGRGTSFAVLDPPVGQTPAQVVAFSQSLNPSGFAALYYPWVNGADPATAAVSALKLQPPGGYALGYYAKNDAQRGSWFAPAGDKARLLSVFGAERKLTETDRDTLNSNNVNTIWQTVNKGTLLWGTRTLVQSLPSMYIPIRRMLSYIEETLKVGTTWAVFQPNDETLWNSLAAQVATFLSTLRQAGGLAGQSDAQAFYVVCDNSINTPQTIASGIVNVQVGVALLYPSEFISFLLGLWQGGQSVTPLAA